MAEKDHLEFTVEASRLFDFYGVLLSSKQNEALNYYYNEDLSLAEIAGLMQVSRQAVHEQIRYGTKALQAYEEKLKLIERFTALNNAIEVLEDKIDTENADISAILEDIKGMI